MHMSSLRKGLHNLCQCVEHLLYIYIYTYTTHQHIHKTYKKMNKRAESPSTFTCTAAANSSGSTTQGSPREPLVPALLAQL